LTELNDRRVELSVGNERKDGELKLVRERIKTYRSQIVAAAEALLASKNRIGEIDDETAITSRKNSEAVKRISEIETQTEVLRAAVAALDKKIEVFEKLSDENRLSQLSEADNLAELKAQGQKLQQQPEVPGGYYVGRSVQQVYWNVVNNGEKVEDMLRKWVPEADDEIRRKTQEYKKD